MQIDASWLIGLHIPAELLPSPVLWIANILFAGILLFAIIQAEFKKLLNNQPSSLSDLGVRSEASGKSRSFF